MGQSATLFRISPESFANLKIEPRSFDLSAWHKEYKTFQQDFDGLLYVLTRNIGPAKALLIKQTFYPNTYLGEGGAFLPRFMEDELGAGAVQAETEPMEVDMENVDTEEDGDFDNFEGGGVYYLSAERVAAINIALNEVNENVVDKHFDAKRMNKLGIYPYAWNDDESLTTAFNRTQLKEDLKRLREIFSAASDQSDYILVLIG